MTDWYNLHYKTALGLVLIIARSNTVIKITAGKLFQLSIATFGDVSNAYIFKKTFRNVIRRNVLKEKLIHIFF